MRASRSKHVSSTCSTKATVTTASAAEACGTSSAEAGERTGEGAERAGEGDEPGHADDDRIEAGDPDAAAHGRDERRPAGAARPRDESGCARVEPDDERIPRFTPRRAGAGERDGARVERPAVSTEPGCDAARGDPRDGRAAGARGVSENDRGYGAIARVRRVGGSEPASLDG